jgi:hypothetical protein
MLMQWCVLVLHVSLGLLINAGNRLVQKGTLHVKTTSFMANGVKLATGATWVQDGNVVITAGLAEAHSEFSLSTPTHNVTLHTVVP